MQGMLQHGRQLLRAVDGIYAPGSSRCAALTACLAIYRADRRQQREHADAWAQLKRAMATNRCEEATRYKAHRATPQQRAAYVSMAEIGLMLVRLTAAGAWRSDMQAHQRWVLCGMAALTVPKRNDWGTCWLWEHAPAWATAPGSDTNFVELAPRPRLVLNKWRKTWRPGAKPVVERLPGLLADMLRASLQLFPRDRLFVDARGQPFSCANSFGQWFQRQTAALFEGRWLGTTLLRHAYVNALDLRMSKRARAQVAKLLLHTPEQTPKYRLNV